jgi:hypothetical protein
LVPLKNTRPDSANSTMAIEWQTFL